MKWLRAFFAAALVVLSLVTLIAAVVLQWSPNRLYDHEAPTLTTAPALKNPVTTTAKDGAFNKEHTVLASNLPANGSVSRTNETLTNPAIFKRQNAVIATKVHGPGHVGNLKQMFCLLTQAYNKHVHNDIVVFSTLPWRSVLVKQLQDLVRPAKLQVIPDPYTLEEQLQNMTKLELEFLLWRCSNTTLKELTWRTICCEPGYQHCAPLGYAWQAEFRSYHVWNHPSLKQYTYMLWMDSDGLCMKPWGRDPVTYLAENGLVLFFDNMYGNARNQQKLREKMKKAYGKSICWLDLTKEGRFIPKRPGVYGKCHGHFMIALVHGFFHITNLDFYRMKQNMNWAKIQVSDHRFSREWDDQIAVTIPPAMLAPERVMDMRSRGFNMSVYHNECVDGRTNERSKPFPYTKWWNAVGANSWPEAKDACGHLIKYGGR